MDFDFQHRIQGGDFAAADRIARPHGLAIEQNCAGFDPFGQARTGEFGEQCGQDRVEATTGGGIGNLRVARAGRGVLGHGQRPAVDEIMGS
ncbi:hypothetical protein D9M71_792620 [compost metagenome]